MTTILQIDSSARYGRARYGQSGKQPHGSHTRRLTNHFLERWLALEPRTNVLSRDVAADPPSPVTGKWVEAAFTRAEGRSAGMRSVLLESDLLVDEVLAADIIVIGAPMYNFGVPSSLKAWIDNIVRVGRTFGFDRQRAGLPYWPMVEPGKQLVVLSARGDGGYGPGGPLENSNLVEASIRVPLAYIGITDFHSIAAEWDEFADERIAASLQAAEAEVDALVERLANERSAAAGTTPFLFPARRPRTAAS